MEKYREITLFPHIKLTSAQAAVLPALCERANLVVPDGETGGLLHLAKPYTLGGDASAKVRQTYRELKKFGDEVLAQNAATADYTTGGAKTPLYDREAPLRIMSDFRADGRSDAVPEVNPKALAAAVTLLLCEDVLDLQNEAEAALAGVDAQSQNMWRRLKDAPDPLAAEGLSLPPDASGDALMKKRLTAWSILARILLLTDADVWLTFEKPVLNLCLTAFASKKPLKEITLEKARAVFYRLPLPPVALAAWLADTDAPYVTDFGGDTILGFVEFLN